MWAHVRAFYGGSDVALGHAYAHITAVIAAAQIVGGPLAALLLRLDGLFGLAGWQILFLFEAVPTLGVAGWVMALPRSPETARCLDPEARRWLAARVRSAAAGGGGGGGGGGAGGGAAAVAAPPLNSSSSSSSSPPGSSKEHHQRHQLGKQRGSSSASGFSSSAASLSSLTSWKIWALGGIEALVSAVSLREKFFVRFFFFFLKKLTHSFLSLSLSPTSPPSKAKYGVIYWTPLLVAAMVTKGGDEFSSSPKADPSSSSSSLHHAPPPPASAAAAVAALSAVPFGLAAVATLANAAHSKRTGERRWHVVWPVAACAAGLAGLGLALNREKNAAAAVASGGGGALAAAAAASSSRTLLELPRRLLPRSSWPRWCLPPPGWCPPTLLRSSRRPRRPRPRRERRRQRRRGQQQALLLLLLQLLLLLAPTKPQLLWDTGWRTRWATLVSVFLVAAGPEREKEKNQRKREKNSPEKKKTH